LITVSAKSISDTLLNCLIYALRVKANRADQAVPHSPQG
jgi:hypothetical protein